MGVRPVRLFLSGDVMTGRGVDQILRHPGDPGLLETYVRDARTYVRLAEESNGPVPRPVDPEWVWGDARDVMAAADVRLVNLETTVTRAGEFASDKVVHYRMEPWNVAVLTVVDPVCVLANNHVLDFGRSGLLETLDTLTVAGVPAAGAGRDLAAARSPAVVDLADRADRADWGRLVVYGFGAESSGIPRHWAATEDSPGVNLLSDLSGAVSDQIAAAKRPGDVVVASVHWGSNWGYDVPFAHVRFAHRLIDAGVDLVHGHSSHHPRPIEIYRDRLVLYGCGDLIDDYEGIGGQEPYRPELRFGYLASLEPDGRLAELRLCPLRMRRLRLHHAGSADREWLFAALNRVCRPYRTRVDAEGILTCPPARA